MLLYPWSLCLDPMALICYNIDADGENFDKAFLCSFVVLSSNLSVKQERHGRRELCIHFGGGKNFSLSNVTFVLLLMY